MLSSDLVHKTTHLSIPVPLRPTYFLCLTAQVSITLFVCAINHEGRTLKLEEKPREEKTLKKRWGHVWASKDQRCIAFEKMISVHPGRPILHGGHVRHYHHGAEARVCAWENQEDSLYRENILCEKTGPLSLNIPSRPIGITWGSCLLTTLVNYMSS